MRRIYLILVSIGIVLATFATPVFLTEQASLKGFNTATAAIVIDQTIPGLGNKENKLWLL